jgi:radical S-adenosyl methionine domain-containing protein 2
MQSDLQTVYNLHITAKCNYKCTFCFAKWECPRDNPKEIWTNLDDVSNLIHELSNKKAAARIFGESERSTRINFAGGEPLLLGNEFLGIIKLTKEMGFETSIITNGSLLNRSLGIYKYIGTLGLSVDSLNADTCRKMGRCDRSGRVLELGRIKELLDTARAENPDIAAKFNVTVNEHNYKECVVGRLQELSPKRIKVLRQLPFNGNSGISDEMYSEFKRINEEYFGENTIIEDNDDMIQSYLMIDPYGRFFQNGNSNGYIYSRPIYEVGLESALSQINFDVERFGSRYNNTDKKEDVL